MLVTLGKEGWPALAKTYQKLALDYNWQTRYSIASSMHIVAGIVEKNITDSALMPLIKAEYINDIDDIRVCIESLSSVNLSLDWNFDESRSFITSPRRSTAWTHVGIELAG